MTGLADAPSVLNAADNARVGVQAENIYGDTVVHIYEPGEGGPDSTAEGKFERGVRNLNRGMAPEARKLLWEAMMEEHDTSEARFYWLIATLSGRTVRQFSEDEIKQLKAAARQRPAEARDSWEDGADIVFQLLESTDVLPTNPKPDIDHVIRQFFTISPKQRDLLLPHLALLLEGPRKDKIWQDECDRAHRLLRDEHRTGRAWKFFQPDPEQPRVRQARQEATTRTEWVIAWTGAATFAGAVGYFGWALIAHGVPIGLLAWTAAIAGGALAAANARTVRFLDQRRRLIDDRLRAPAPAASGARQTGFAGKVDTLFRRYTARPVADPGRRTEWLAATAGILNYDRDEIVSEFGGTSVSAERLAWLVRFRVRQSWDDWHSGRLDEYPRELQAQPAVLLARGVGGAVAIIAVVGAVYALRVAPFADVGGAVACFLTGRWSWRRWLRIDLERRRFKADTEESAQRLEQVMGEFTRWSNKLRDRPADAEIATWLDCDRTNLLGAALDHYKLARHQVKAHAFLEEPGRNAKRARVSRGPMRYSNYRIIVFVLTSDGVRQVEYDLLFLEGKSRERSRLSYRYDAVASAHVKRESPASETTRIQREFTLTLVNGNPVTALVTDLSPDDIEEGEDAESLAKATLDTASVANTLHILEGIAAEGKAWLNNRKTQSTATATAR